MQEGSPAMHWILAVDRSILFIIIIIILFIIIIITVVMIIISITMILDYLYKDHPHIFLVIIEEKMQPLMAP